MTPAPTCTRIAVYYRPDRPKLRQQWPVAEGHTPPDYITRDGVRWPLLAVFTQDDPTIPSSRAPRAEA